MLWSYVTAWCPAARKLPSSFSHGSSLACDATPAPSALLVDPRVKVVVCPRQVVLTTIEPSKEHQELSFDAYEYTVRLAPNPRTLSQEILAAYCTGKACCC